MIYTNSMEYRFLSETKTIFLDVPYKLVIVSESGVSLDMNKAGKLKALVKNTKTGASVSFDDECFKWTRQENASEFGTKTGSEIDISASDLVYGSANFICSFAKNGLYWKDTTYITISESVKGEDGFSFTLQITSSNGSTFRFPNVSTVLSCVVFKNTDDITDQLEDSRFSWKRNSGDAVADYRWNTSSKAIGHKSVSITSEDCSGRTVFDCEVDLEGIE